jgi:hypothetical protein
MAPHDGPAGVGVGDGGGGSETCRQHGLQSNDVPSASNPSGHAPLGLQ